MNLTLTGKNLFHGKPMNLKGFSIFDDSFPFQRGQEEKFQETSREKEIRVVIYPKILQKSLEYVA